jgi:hypothetical protein
MPCYSYQHNYGKGQTDTAGSPLARPHRILGPRPGRILGRTKQYPLIMPKIDHNSYLELLHYNQPLTRLPRVPDIIS